MHLWDVFISLCVTECPHISVNQCIAILYPLKLVFEHGTFVCVHRLQYAAKAEYYITMVKYSCYNESIQYSSPSVQFSAVRYQVKECVCVWGAAECRVTNGVSGHLHNALAALIPLAGVSGSLDQARATLHNSIKATEHFSLDQNCFESKDGIENLIETTEPG